MNVVLHSARSIFYLLAANCVLGIITAFFCSLIVDIERFAVAIVRKRFIAFRDYISIDISNSASVFLTDLTACLLAASFMLLTAFIYNSGNFRLVSIPVFIIGFVFGKRCLYRVIKKTINRILFFVKWIFDVAAFPIIWFATAVVKMLSNTINKIRTKYRTKRLSKYTEDCFAQINDEAEHGLLDDYYKELENERTI